MNAQNNIYIDKDYQINTDEINPDTVFFNESTITLLSGLKVRVIDEGKGPILLLLHGNPDNADEWKPLIHKLKNQYRCIAPDLPGYGRKGKTFKLPENFEYTVQNQINFVDEILDAVNVNEKITLVIHDIGGIMGVPWAAQNITRLNAMLFTNTVAYLNYEWFKMAYQWGSEKGMEKKLANLIMSSMAWGDGKRFKKAFAKQNPQLTPAQVNRFNNDFALNDIAKETTLKQFRHITKMEYFDGYDVMLKNISAAIPTVTIWGDNDPYLETHFAAQLYTDETIILPNVGHWVPILASDKIAEQVIKLVIKGSNDGFGL